MRETKQGREAHHCYVSLPCTISLYYLCVLSPFAVSPDWLPCVTCLIIPCTVSFALVTVSVISGCRFWNTRNTSSANPCPIKSIPRKSKMTSRNSSNLRSMRLACDLATGFPSGHISLTGINVLTNPSSNGANRSNISFEVCLISLSSFITAMVPTSFNLV